MIRSLPSSFHIFLLLGIIVSVSNRTEAEEFPSAQLDFFEKKIRPVLVKHCYECHSPEAKTVQGGLYLHTRNGLLTGGDSGPATVPKKIEEGSLLESLRYETFEMPPSGKLPDEVIQDFETWIRMGVPDPRTGEALSLNREIDLNEGRKFWAFIPPQHVAPPEVNQTEFLQQPMDAFILKALESNSLKPGPKASRQVMIRRLHYDLIGLPPTPEQIAEFLQDDPEDAYSNLVDHLLSLPAFGERWGRHWLDVARYADSTGGGRSRLYGNAWRYRDYVIQSFQNDKPYNQFIKEQIAGDLLPAESLEQEREQLVACGFLMLGPHNYELQDKALLRMEVVDEQITTIGKGILGMTIGCARCHDHKFDPIPTTDYYALAGIFRSTKSLGEGNVTNWITRKMPVDEKVRLQLEKSRKQINMLSEELSSIDNRLKQLQSDSPGKSVIVEQLAGLTIDAIENNQQTKLVGEWKESTSIPGYVGDHYIHDINASKGNKKVTFLATLPHSGRYEVRVSYTTGSNRASNVPVTIKHRNNTLATAIVNQKKKPELKGGFTSIGVHDFSFDLQKDSVVTIEINNINTNGVVIVDAVQFIPEELLLKSPQLANSSLTQTKELSQEHQTEIVSLNSQKEDLNAQLKSLTEQSPPEPPDVMAVKEQTPEECHDMQLCIRGNIRNLGESVPRGLLTVATKPGHHTISTSNSGRLELAEWLGSSENPLSARVMVNRIWAHLFGTGLVRTVDNFGTTGELPSHPELLDQLTVEFVNNNWSIKHLIKQIVLSRTYQLSSQTTQRQLELDPENRLLSRFPRRRADAEFLRDALLHISGQLEHIQGGPTVKPGTKSEFGYQFTSHLRSVYLPAFRNRIEDLLNAFDFPNPNLVQGRRTTTTLATQALLMMNHPAILEYSKATARKLLEDSSDKTTRQKLNWLYLSSLGRQPSQTELALCEDYLTRVQPDNSEFSDSELWETLCQTLFSSVDFRYIE